MSATPSTTKHSILFTNEVMMARALAAEIRHDSPAFVSLLEESLSLHPGTLGKLASVSCEAVENIDVLTVFDTGTTVGLEAKIDHAVTEEQLSRELPAVDHLVLLVLDPDDAGRHADSVGAVLTWAEALGAFDAPRVTLADVESIPATKVQVERKLRSLNFEQRLPKGWRVVTDRGGAGMPSIEVHGPRLADGRELRGQIQATGRSLPTALNDVGMEFHVGIQTNLDSVDFPEEDEGTDEPETPWVTYLKDLHEHILDGRLDEYGIRLNNASAGKSKFGASKMRVAKAHLSGKLWLAVGYCDWALGPKSTVVPLGDLEELADRAAKLFREWHEHIA